MSGAVVGHTNTTGQGPKPDVDVRIVCGNETVCTNELCLWVLRMRLSSSHFAPPEQAVYNGGVVSELRALQLQQLYNSLGWGIESLGFSIVFQPMSASPSASLRADYGGALNRCVAIIGRANQHSAGAEGAPYRLSIE
eukprot:scaffold52724_cov287-Isochrysis_galbana.AAC.1